MLPIAPAALWWILALCIGVPIFAVWWWARRQAGPAGDYVDYLGQRAPSPTLPSPDGHAAPAESAGHLEAPGLASAPETDQH